MRLTATLATAAACLGLTASAPPEPKKDAQAAVEPRSGPGAGQAFLARFEGDWDVAKAFFPRNGDPARATGRCRQTMTQGGRFLQSEFTFGEGEKATTGLGLIGFEPESDTFTSVWVDSRQTQMSLRQSRDKFDGEAIILYSASLGPAAKPERRSKTVTRWAEPGKQILHRQYALSPDGTERLMMELVLTRRTGP